MSFKTAKRYRGGRKRSKPQPFPTGKPKKRPRIRAPKSLSRIKFAAVKKVNELVKSAAGWKTLEAYEDTGREKDYERFINDAYGAVEVELTSIPGFRKLAEKTQEKLIEKGVGKILDKYPEMTEEEYEEFKVERVT